MSMDVEKPVLRKVAKAVGLSFAYLFALPMIYGIAYLGLLSTGGLPGPPRLTRSTDVYLHDTYSVASNFYYPLVGAVILAYFGSLHFLWPKVTGHTYSKAWGKAIALLFFIGFNLTFFPQFLLGMWGMHQRYHAYPPYFGLLNIVSTVGVTVLALGFLLPVFCLPWSLKYRPCAISKPSDP
jgi:cytochrome c oxidase subunit 1